ncbi:MAG: guanylate kinase [Lactobacillaceae bacterium]|jgi:guanylate kinase|nr:guanylate kinase [Lactobacillaceae bacterium]
MGQHVIVITGASGAGKTTVASYITETYGLPKVITHTTRPKRDGEIDGVDYYFETLETFNKNHFIEQVAFSGNHYGSSYEGLERAFEQSQNTKYPDYILLVVDTVGAITYFEELGNKAEVWFITTTDREEFKERLVQRGDDPKQVELRTSSSDFERDMILPEELSQKAQVIFNDKWEETTKSIDSLFNETIGRVK